jgi:hypothetical protein
VSVNIEKDEIDEAEKVKAMQLFSNPELFKAAYQKEGSADSDVVKKVLETDKIMRMSGKRKTASKAV